MNKENYTFNYKEKNDMEKNKLYSIEERDDIFGYLFGPWFIATGLMLKYGFHHSNPHSLETILVPAGMIGTGAAILAGSIAANFLKKYKKK